MASARRSPRDVAVLAALIVLGALGLIVAPAPPALAVPAAPAAPAALDRSVLLDYQRMAELAGVGTLMLHRGYGSIDGGVAWSWAIGDWGDVGLRHVVVGVAEQSCAGCSWAARVAAVPREYPKPVLRSASRVVAWSESIYGTKVIELRRSGALVVAVAVSFPPGHSTRVQAQSLARRVAAAQAAMA